MSGTLPVSGQRHPGCALLTPPATHLPDAWLSEDGAHYWIEGHVSPGEAVNASVAAHLRDWGLDETHDLFIGVPVDAAAFFARTEQLLASTSHRWLRVNYDGEMALPVDAEHPDATAWTLLVLP